MTSFCGSADGVSPDGGGAQACYSPLVPLGSFHDETGLLLRERDWLILQRDDGGRWRLEVTHKADRWAGKRVRVRGVRSGFDVLSVKRIDNAS